MPRNATVGVVLAAMSCLLIACGEESSSPSPVTPPTPVPQGELSVELGTASASFLIDGGGGPGLIRYNECYAIHFPRSLFPADVTVQRVEHWTIGPDGSVYDNRTIDSLHGMRMGRSSLVSGTSSCVTPGFDDRDIVRPPGSIFRLMVGYTFDSGSPEGLHVVTSDKEIVAKVPARPLMTGLSMATDVPGRPALLYGLRPMKFLATGVGGTAPYQFQFRYGNNVVLRDWSSERAFVWDGVLNGAPITPRGFDMTVLARSAGGNDPEVMKIQTIILVQQ